MLTGEFVPPYPLRHEKLPAISELVGMARRNLLEVWPKSAFSNKIGNLNVLFRQMFICNSPETEQ